MEFDVVIVGGGPSGLAAAIRLRQLAQTADREMSVCLIEKGAEIGAHILSGAVIEPDALGELIPDWRDKGAPLTVEAASDAFWLLTPDDAHRLPVPPHMHNRGNYIVSLGNVCRFLAQEAEALGAEIFPGFPGAEVLYDETGAVIGVATGDMGRLKDGSEGPNFEPGVELIGKQTIFAEGCRGSLTKTLIRRFELDRDCEPQTYGIGIKELWQVDPSVHEPGRIVHTIGWPLDRETYGGSFIYHLDERQVAIGFVIGLDYRNPYLSPFEEFQRFKTHKVIRPLLEGGQRIAYGARALAEGGYQSIPKLTFPGGLLVGDTAGFLNVPKIKGTHNALRSGRIAAEQVFATLAAQEPPREAVGYRAALESSPVFRELKAVRNIRPGFRWGLWAGLAHAALDTYLLRGKAPWTLGHKPDHTSLRRRSEARRIDYPKPDGVLTFDRMSSVYISNTAHDENQPVHLVLREPAAAIDTNLRHYGAPEQYYCPAGVYEIVEDNGAPRLQINAANCVHCKTCDIKDPGQNIDWTVPEGGGGPNYPNM